MIMTDDNRPSIAELQRTERAMTPADWEWVERDAEICTDDGGATIMSGGSVGYDNASMIVDQNDARGVVSLRNAAPVLLEIVDAAYDRSMAECSCGAELGCFPGCTREIAEHRLLTALAKVRP